MRIRSFPLSRLAGPLRTLSGLARPFRNQGPLCIAILANIGIVLFFSVVSLTVCPSRGDAVRVILGNVVSKDEIHLPPSGGNEAVTQAEIAKAAQEMMTKGPTTFVSDVNSLITTAPSALSFEVGPPASSPSAEIASAMAEATQLLVAPAGKNAASSTPQRENQGNQFAKGYGNQAERGSKPNKYPRSAKAMGNVGDGWEFSPGNDTFQNQKIVLLLDVSESMALNNRPEVISHIVGKNHVVGTITFYWTTVASAPKNDAAIKELAKKNDFAVWQEAASAWTGIPRSTGNGVRTDTGNIYYGILMACEKYAGQNALLVVVSDLNEIDSRMEDVPYLVDKLTNARLRLYFIKLSGGLYMRSYTNPDFPSAFVTAVMSGGGVRNVDTRQIGNGETIEFENPYR